MKLIDTHCHLTNRRLADNVSDVLSQARDAGVVAMISAASSVADARAASELAGREPSVYFTAGVHPHEAADVAADYIQQLASLAGMEKCVAIGEIGLDYHYDFSPRDAQKRVFAEQLKLAGELGAVIVVHTREAFDDTLAIMQENQVDFSRAVFHSFTGPLDQASQLTELGATIGFSGIVTFSRSDDLRASAAEVPAGQLLIETDSPYLSPVPVRKVRTNTPTNVAHIASCLANVRNCSVETIAEQTTANAVRLFGLELS